MKQTGLHLTRLNAFYRSEKYKIFISILFGLLGFIASFFSLQFYYGDFKIIIYWGLIFPLLVVLSLGRRYGIISIVFGLTILQPFFVSRNMGWVNLVSFINYIIWFYLIGSNKKWTFTKKYYANLLILQLIYVIISVILYILAFYVLSKFNISIWKKETSSIQFNYILVMAYENIIYQTVLLMMSDILLLIPQIGRLFRLEYSSSSRNNTRILVCALTYGILIFLFIMTDHYVIGKNQRTLQWLLDPSHKFKMNLLVVVLGSLVFGGVLARIYQYQFEISEKLQVSEAKYHSIFENLNDIYYEITIEGIIITISPSVKDLLGYDEKDLIGINIGKLYVDYTQRFEMIKTLLNNREIKNYEITLNDVHGEPHYVWLHAKIVEDHYGQKKIIGMFRDVTQVKEANKKREESERNYGLLYDKMMNGFVVYEPIYNVSGDIDDVVFVDVNPSFVRVTGLLKDAIIGRTWSSVFRYKNRYLSEYKRILQGDNTVQIENYNPVLQQHYMTYTFKINNNQIGVIFEDITERKKKEEEIKELAANLAAIFESTPDNIWLVDENCQIITYNQAFINTVKKITGVDIRAFNNISEKISESLFTAWKDYYNKALAEGRFTVEREAGEYSYEASFNPIYKDGMPKGIAVFSKDITDRKNTEKELAKLNEELAKLNEELEQRVIDRTRALQSAVNELEAFTYTVTHDLKSPLKAISAYGRMIKEDYSELMEGELEEFINRIMQISRDTIQMIDKLLQYSTTVGQIIFKEKVDFNEMILTLFNEITSAAPERQIELSFETVLPYVYADKLLIKRVIDNILSNAVKFTKTREKAIINVSYAIKAGEVIFAFADNGVGFDMDMSDKLFNIFIRLHSTEEYEGNGIGLATVRKIVELHGGRTWIEGNVDQGARAYFTLPVINRIERQL